MAIADTGQSVFFWRYRWMGRCTDGWMEEVGVVGGGKGEMRVIKGGNMGQNLARKAKELVGRRDEWSKD